MTTLQLVLILAAMVFVVPHLIAYIADRFNRG